MIYGLKPYPAMKDTGIEWLGSIPGHWDVHRMKYLLRERDERSLDGNEQLLRVSQYTGVTERKALEGSDEPDTRAASLVGYKVVNPNELVVNIMLAWNGSMGVSPFKGICSPAYCVYRFSDSIHPKYFHNLLRSPMYKARIKAVSTGVVESRLRLYTDDLYRLEGIAPPEAEQAVIVKYLDYMDQRIKKLISAKKKLIKLLEEQKQAIIHQAVTKGLNPNVPMKDSGVEWLGEVPKHWEIRRMKTLCSMKSGENITSMTMEPSGAYPVFGGNGIRGFSENYTHEGDYALVGRQGALCGNVHVVHGKFWASEHAVVASLKDEYSLDWFAFTLEVMNLNQYSIAAAQPGLSVDRILNLWVPAPDRNEQKAISKHIKKGLVNIDLAMTRANNEVTLLNEYKIRLISDVVTGKLDVREAAAGLPMDEIENEQVGSDE